LACWWCRLREKGKLTEQLIGCSDKQLCCLDSLFSLVGRGGVRRQVGVFEFVAAASQVGKGPEALSELCAYCALDGVVASTGRGA
jgi:hypothetical protein